MRVCGEQAMKDFGRDMINACQQAVIITLKGNLGTGKTTLVRGALEARGVTSGVRSPTYTLIEHYPFPGLSIAHFDLYRLADPEELEYLGFRDYLNDHTICLIEWPEKAEGFLDQVDVQISLEYEEDCRLMSAQGFSEYGKELVKVIGFK